MEGNKYLLTSPKIEGDLLFTYDQRGALVEYKCNAELTDKQAVFVFQNFPFAEDQLQNLPKLFPVFTLKPVTQDLSFEAFWERYEYKVGNKKRAEKLWDQLPDSDKLKVFQNIPAYNYYLTTRPQMEKLYPETYLNQRRFESNYKTAVK